MISFHKRTKNVSSICLKNKINYKVLHSSKQLVICNIDLLITRVWRTDLKSEKQVVKYKMCKC